MKIFNTIKNTVPLPKYRPKNVPKKKPPKGNQSNKSNIKIKNTKAKINLIYKDIF